MIQVEHLVKKYGDKLAVNDISFSVGEGEILGFLGPNGAGKSTTMNILTGYLSASGGVIKIGGVDVLEDPIEAKRQIGFLPEQPPLYMDMTVKEYLDFVYDIKGVKFPRRPHINEICELVKITDVYHRTIKHLSKGYKQRVGLAQALMGNPKVLILDEPTVGLDPRQIIEIRNLIKKLGKNHTVILSTHILQEVQSVCDRILIINKGQIIADGNTEQLTYKAAGNRKLVTRIAGPQSEVKKLLLSIPDVLNVESLGSREAGSNDFLIEASPVVDIRKPLFRALAQSKYAMIGLKSMDMSLEDMFVKLVTEDTQGGEAL